MMLGANLIPATFNGCRLIALGLGFARHRRDGFTANRLTALNDRRHRQTNGCTGHGHGWHTPHGAVALAVQR
jgi:hypothetical protein